MKHYRVQIDLTVDVWVSGDNITEANAHHAAQEKLGNRLDINAIDIIDAFRVQEIEQKEVKVLTFALTLPVLPKDIEQGKNALVEWVRGMDGADIMDCTEVTDGGPKDEPTEFV